MCNVHIIFPIKGKITNEETKLMKSLLIEGAKGNKDAWGACNDNVVIGANGKYRKQTLKHFLGGKFLIGHNRLATQGLTIQPIRYKDWIIAHNGIFREYSTYDTKKEPKDSDSVLFLKDLVDMIGQKRNYLPIIEKKLGDTTGTFSFFLINQKDGRVFYCKNKATDMHMFLIKSGERYLIVGSTKKNNINEMMKGKKYGFETKNFGRVIVAKKEMEAGIIYEFVKNKGMVDAGYFELEAGYDWTKWCSDKEEEEERKAPREKLYYDDSKPLSPEDIEKAYWDMQNNNNGQKKMKGKWW